MKSKQEIKKFFENGDIPNQEQFWEWQDSYWHKEEQIPADKVDLDLSHKADLLGGKVPASQLPSYVDDVVEFPSFSSLPAQGESGKIYVTIDNDNLYRWAQTQYVNITQGDIGTLQTVTERGKETTENIKIQGIYFGGLENAQNIIIGDESTFVNNRAGGTIAIGKGTKPEGTDHLVIGNNAVAINDSGSIGNTVVGHFSMAQSTSSSENSVFGYNAFSNANNAFANTVYGTYAGLFSGDTLTQNTILGYFSGCGLGTLSTNNIIIGAESTFGNAVLQNKLYIHSSTLGSIKTVSHALISGDFVDRYVNINGKFSVTPGQMPSSDSSYTKNIVAKPDGTFGWENKVTGIPLSGTEINKPITGNIEFDNLNGTKVLKGNAYNSYISFLDDGVVEINNSPNSSNVDISGIDLNGTSALANGILGSYYYGAYYTDNSFIQKKYSDKQHSYTSQEEKTGGKWINGKPIYRKTVVYNTLPYHGEIDISRDFTDVEMIVSNQMFTEWYAMDIAFAGNQWNAEAFITIQPKSVKIQSIKMPDYDYSLIDSFTLTLEYTKTTN
ncbi:hypothetical protein [Chryseobacterium daeguense]|uniref:hypothetical protein n=1 Tax=Chryseobacterium daeguense TaxID=412438 RepID=UPI0003FDE4BD|nr:hypothetical protein [Chryseobacterium daeguense]